MKKINSRQCALDVLIDIDENKAFSNIAINKYLRGKEIEPVEKRLVTELVYGVLENKIYLDFIISKFSKIRIKKIKVHVLNILRMGLYQIIFLDKIPEFAAVNESVNLVKKVDFKATGYVNGILRNYLRNKENIKIPKIEEDPVAYLSIVYSHPKWMVKKWIEEFGETFTKELLQSNNERPKLIIRTNTLKISKAELIDELTKEGIKVKEGKYVEEALHIANAGSIEEIESYKKGFFQVQDESSMLVAHVLDPKPGEFIIDLCAAPGGKTTHIAQLMKNKGNILARDIYEHKLKLIKNNALRLGIKMINTEVFDGEKLDLELLEKADKVLVDAPCSGLGIIRRKPELKYNKELDEIEDISKLQLEILNNASKYVKKGGYLVYSTCTIMKEENKEVVENFLRKNDDFDLVDIKEKLPLGIRVEGKYLQLYPNIHDVDGFFICKLRKK